MGTYSIKTFDEEKEEFIEDVSQWSKYSSQIKKIIINDGITSISPRAFKDFKNLNSISIPTSVTKIYESAFENCSSLINIDIPTSVTDIGHNAFKNTPWLDEKLSENPLVIVNNLSIDGTSCKGSVTIPNSVRSIEEGAFYGCQDLTEIFIPTSVTTIKNYAFFIVKI